MKVDVIIVGAGPIGLACGVEAHRAGLTSLIIEKGALVNSLLGYPVNMEFFSTPELLEIGGHPLATLRYKPLREDAIDYYRRVADHEELNVRLYERVTGLKGEDGAFTVITDKGRYGCRKVVLATGFFDQPNMMGVPGEDLPKVSHYYREPYAYTGQNLAIIGAKNSAAKAALECYRSGANVTMIARESAVSGSVKYWIKPDLENRIQEGSIRAFFNASVRAITPNTIVFDTDGRTVELENDWVLALTGYHPDYELMQAFGIAAGSDPARTPVHDPETFETNREGVYMAGTVLGGLNTSRWFIENGRFHAERIMSSIAAEKLAG